MLSLVIRVTLSPIWVSDDATSRPMKLPPTTTARLDRRAAASQGFGVLEGAQIEYAVKGITRDIQPLEPGACRNQELSIADVPGVLGVHRFPFGIDGGCPDTEHEFDIMSFVVRPGEDVELVLVLLAEEELLGKRRPGIRQPRFGGHDRNGALRAMLAQRLCRGGSGRSAANDQEVHMSAH